jgi:hypothetical protein
MEVSKNGGCPSHHAQVIHPPLATARLRLERVGTTGARQLVLSQADLMRITLVCVFLG